MRIIVAPESYTLSSDEVSCFLAGGITGCAVWQEEVIEQLKRLEEIDEDLNRLVIFNPRRSEWPTDTNEIQKQIQWEHDSLEASDIFSMYFVNSESVQPICLYELGKHTELWRLIYGELATSFMTIGIEDGYKRALDVEMQMTCDHLEGAIRLNATPLIHATAIASCLKEYLAWKKKEIKIL